MAGCSEITDGSSVYEALSVEQKDEITALEAIFQEDFRILEDDGGCSLGKIAFDLAVKVHSPFEGEINIEAFIPVEAEEIRRLSISGSDSDGPREDARGGSESTGNAGPEEPEGAAAAATAATSTVVAQGIDEASAQPRRHNAESLKPSSLDDGPEATSRKPRFCRSVSLQHWHVRAGVQYLTPVHLRCNLPDSYPELQPPELSISCLWLSQHQVRELCKKLLSLWDEAPDQPVVFTWADWLQNNLFDHLNLGPHLLLRQRDDECLEGAGSTVDSVSLQTALLAIFENDLAMQQEAFMQSRHLCEVCFDEKNAEAFVYFEECRHFFCAECMTAHCQMHVDGGSVLQMLCPTPKCEVVIPPDILQRILDSERYQRWERLMLSKTLDRMGDVVYCPRCNVPVLADEDVESTQLAQCATCFYAFCTDCQSQWHHGTPCWPYEEETRKSKKDKQQKKKKNWWKKKNTEYDDEDSGDGDERSVRKRGVAMNSLMFIRTMKKMGKYQSCPKCKMMVERVSGCDMMHCSQCKTMFCWSCGLKISGYDHFGGCRGRTPDPAVREPTVGEQLEQQFKRENPNAKVRLKNCPRCHQRNIKNANNNHLTCWACKTDFCYQCCKSIRGVVSSHFSGSSPCSQHSED